MKKAIILAAMLALPTFAGQKLVYNAPAPAPTFTAPAAEDGPALEIGYTISWGAAHIFKGMDPNKSIRSNGVDLTGVYEFNRHHAVTLRAAYSLGARSWADETEIDDHGELVGSHNRVRMHTFSVMPGYRYTQPLCSHCALYAGVNAGLTNQSIKDSYYENGAKDFTGHDSAWGFAYSAEAGARISLTPCTEFFVAYHFTGSTARNSHDDIKTHHQVNHGIRTGFEFKF